MNWSLLLSGLALCVSLGSVIWVQRRTDNREFSKWRRDTLTKTTVDFIKLSTQRSNYIRRYVSEYSHYKKHVNFDDQSGFMTSASSLLATIEICDSEKMYLEAQAIHKLHKKSETLVGQFVRKNSTEDSPSKPDAIGEIFGYLNKIDHLHNGLIAETKQAMQ
ncbi:hypothetical protein RhoFasSB10_03039 [Rhodococcus fascians]|uniref:hypothetical protein n=1 Tax=Rhodococcoides fascians TaxID=1828 RepID=UPI001427D058|nr:hypothetical protein [Rhodococcus fascians]